MVLCKKYKICYVFAPDPHGGEKSDPDPDPDPFKSYVDPKHCLKGTVEPNGKQEKTALCSQEPTEHIIKFTE